MYFHLRGLMFQRLWHSLDTLFPEQEIFTRRLPIRITIPLFVTLTTVISLGASVLPMNSLIGFDWKHFFGNNNFPPFYPPWTLDVVKYMTFPILVGITLSAILLAVIQRSVHIISAAAAMLSLPVLWTVFLGQLEGIVVLGMLGLPWLIPLVIIKPQISFFGLGARRSYILAFVIFLILSIAIWRNWPVEMLSVNQYYGEGRYVQDIALGWWGLPFFLATVWFSRGDMDMLMASGAFISPHIIFYNLLPLTPAVARLTPRAAIVATILSYFTLSSNRLGANGWWLGWGFVVWVWTNLAAQRYPELKYSRWLNRIVGYRLSGKVVAIPTVNVGQLDVS